jgi:hypothetical protein
MDVLGFITVTLVRHCEKQPWLCAWLRRSNLPAGKAGLTK